MSENGSNDTGGRDDVVVRKAERGWVVGEENVSDLTSAMVLADLFAADQAVRGEAGSLEAGRRRRTSRGRRRRAGRPAGPPPPRHNERLRAAASGAQPG